MGRTQMIDYDHIDPESLSGEERFELESAFGREAVENREIVRIDVDSLEPVDEPSPIEQVDFDPVEVGDVITVRFPSGTVYTGEVTDASDYTFRTDVISGDDHGRVHAYSDFLRDRHPTEMMEIDRSG